MDRSLAGLAKNWRKTGNSLLEKHVADGEGAAAGRVFLLCADELDARLNGNQGLLLATALLVGALTVGEPLLPEHHEPPSDATFSLVPPKSVEPPVGAAPFSAEHTHQEEGGKSTLIVTSSAAASGVNVAAKTTKVSFPAVGGLKT